MLLGVADASELRTLMEALTQLRSSMSQVHVSLGQPPSHALSPMPSLAQSPRPAQSSPLRQIALDQEGLPILAKTPPVHRQSA